MKLNSITTTITIHFPNYYSNFKDVCNFKSTRVSLNFPLSFMFNKKTTGK